MPFHLADRFHGVTGAEKGSDLFVSNFSSYFHWNNFYLH